VGRNNRYPKQNSFYVPFADFIGDVDWEHVQQIVFVIESGG